MKSKSAITFWNFYSDDVRIHHRSRDNVSTSNHNYMPIYLIPLHVRRIKEIQIWKNKKSLILCGHDRGVGSPVIYICIVDNGVISSIKFQKKSIRKVYDNLRANINTWLIAKGL